MATQTTNAAPSGVFPKISVDTAVLILLAGAAGTIAFDIFGRALSPMFGFASLAPVGLARAFLGTIGLPNGAPLRSDGTRPRKLPF